jgi:cell division protein FtsB
MRPPFKKWAFAIACVASVSYAVVTLSGPHGIRALQEKQRLIQEMQKRNTVEAQEIERIKEHIQRLDESPAEQELEIRERLKLVHPDEKVFITGQPEKR